MAYSKLCCLMALVTIGLTAPINTDSSSSASGVIEVPLKKGNHQGFRNSLTRRSMAEDHIDVTGMFYFTEYSIGGQTQRALLDSGSSDTWTYSSVAWSGGFDPSKSSTYKWLNDDLRQQYGSGGISGTWAEDTLSIGGAEVPNYQFGLLNQTLPFIPGNRGILAIGPKSAESSANKYPTFAERLRDAGVIQSNSFSLFSGINDFEATLLFGGIDTAKFSGPLYTLPFDTTEVYGNSFYAINFEFQGTTYSNGILDSGTSNIGLPSDVVKSLADSYGATWHDAYGCYFLTSPPPANLPGLQFKIGGVNITIPASDLFVKDGPWYFFAVNSNQVENGDELNILGDPILRRLYLFFDIDNNGIAFAPIVNTDESNLVAVGSSIPNAVPAPNQIEGGGVGSS